MSVKSASVLCVRRTPTGDLEGTLRGQAVYGRPITACLGLLADLLSGSRSLLFPHISVAVPRTTPGPCDVGFVARPLAPLATPVAGAPPAQTWANLARRVADFVPHGVAPIPCGVPAERWGAASSEGALARMCASRPDSPSTLRFILQGGQSLPHANSWPIPEFALGLRAEQGAVSGHAPSDTAAIVSASQ